MAEAGLGQRDGGRTAGRPGEASHRHSQPAAQQPGRHTHTCTRAPHPPPARAPALGGGGGGGRGRAPMLGEGLTVCGAPGGSRDAELGLSRRSGCSRSASCWHWRRAARRAR